jgi:hypothetical protein
MYRMLLLSFSSSFSLVQSCGAGYLLRALISEDVPGEAGNLLDNITSFNLEP